MKAKRILDTAMKGEGMLSFKQNVFLLILKSLQKSVEDKDLIDTSLKSTLRRLSLIAFRTARKAYKNARV